MTLDEWMDEYLDLIFTLPRLSGTPLEKERRRQMFDRIIEIENYLKNYPKDKTWKEPDPNWKLTVPDATPEEKKKLEEYWCEVYAEPEGVIEEPDMTPEERKKMEDDWYKYYAEKEGAVEKGSVYGRDDDKI